MQLPSSSMQLRYVLEKLNTEARGSRKSQFLSEIRVSRLNLKQKHCQASSLTRHTFKKAEKSVRQLSKAVENKMFPHFLAVFQWTLLTISIAFNMNFAVSVTGAVANSGLKVIMLFHIWMLFFPVVLCPMFYRIRKEGMAERCIIGLSMVTLLFSIANISLHFVDNLVLLMKATEVVAWSLYNSMFFISIYKISIGFLPLVLSRFVKFEKETLRNNKKLST